MYGRKEQILAKAWQRQWRKACRSKDPTRRWASFQQLVGRGGPDLVRDAMILWATRPDGGDAEAGFLVEVVRTVRPRETLAAGWLEAWAAGQARSGFGGVLHDAFAAEVFAEPDAFWRALSQWRTPAARLELYDGLDADRLCRCYFHDPARAPRLIAATGDVRLTLLQKAGGKGVESWNAELAAAIVPACLSAITGDEPPPQPARIGELHADVAEEWLRTLARMRLTYALAKGTHEAWDAVPCTVTDQQRAGVYNESLVEAAVAHLHADATALKTFPKFLLDKICETKAQRTAVVHALLGGIEKKLLSWTELPEGLADWIGEQFEHDLSGALARAVLERLRRETMRGEDLPEAVRGRILAATLRLADEQMELTGEAVARTGDELYRMLWNEEPSA